MTTLCINPACPQPENDERARVCTTCGQPLWIADRYCCQQFLGQGGFGRTYLAVDESSDPPVVCVVKQMTLAVGSDRAFLRDRFHREADRLATLGQHPQIPALLAVIDNAQGQFLVQEYIPGPNLDQLIQQSPEVGGEALVQRVLYELLPVLVYIHDHSVIHRDIKPANIIAPPSPRSFALVDFGSAKAIADPEQLKRTATVIGSAGYAAPEQALGKAVYASDIFSLGVTCLHLLTGLHPFDLYSVSDDAWVWQPYVTAPTSPALGRVLDRMVNRRLQERYSNAQEVLADLRWSGLVLNIQDSKPSQVLTKSLNAAPVWEQRFALSLPGVVANGLAMSPNGRAIATACSDGSVRLWDCTNGELIHAFRRSLGLLGMGHRGAVNAVAFTTAGDAIVSGGEDSQLIRWSLDDYTGQKLPVSGWQISSVLIAPLGDTLAVGSGDGRILLWSLAEDNAPKTLVHHQDQVTALAVDVVENLLVSGGRDRTIRLWSLPSGRLTRTLTAPKVAITALTCHPQDGRIVSGDREGHVQVWSAEHPDQGLVIYKAPSPITALAISSNGHWLAIGAENGHLTLSNLQGLGQTSQMHHAWGVRAIAFTPDSRMLVSTSADETIRFWCFEAD
ncbi:serine/threonine-protein kinase [Leptolyngbya sp. CCNP1308]|uniref:serine/threonine-protein kinase n=1 Tax=Leptolyngbya sp. CCNP1308 TaxID=3110255 RepID=UPI002B219B79|nr:serine/threonine-protein kinase [Leptolyngbya sp. CCNP1308]MEA5448880.1 serine/threonine-protein kinase [Leptolyngbya sp. CCNP1308]